MDRRQFVEGLALGALGMASPGRAAAAPPLELKVEAGDLVARSAGRPLLRYNHRTVTGPPGTPPLLARSGHLHPVHAPNGALVTDDFSPDHAHQRGIFSAWTRTRVTIEGETLQPDFWNLHAGTGRTRSTGVELLPVTTGQPGFRAQLVSEARRGERWEALLNETWEIRFPPQQVGDPDAADAAYFFDLTARQKPRVAIELPKYHYGGMAVRGAREWAKGSDVAALTSEGMDRAGADGAKARWLSLYGTVRGKTAGIALLEHPANLHAPNAVRMHPDMPYYVFALPQSGPLTLEAGREYVFRYRVVTHNGRAERGLLDRLWRELAGER